MPTEYEDLPAYGMPVRSLAGGEVDSDGYLRRNPAEPVWNLLRVQGPLDAARLAAAVERVSLATDVLHLRLRSTDRGPRLVQREPVPLKLEIRDVESPVVDGRLAKEVALDLAPLLFDKIDLRHEPAGRVCLVRGAHGGEQLLALSFDHSLLDGWSLGLLTRALAGAYRTGDYTPRGRGFADFVRALPAQAERERSLSEWSGLLEKHPLPGPPLHLPGGRSKWPEPFEINGYFDRSLPPRVPADLTAAVAHTGLTRAQLLSAATALATGLFAEGPQPVLSLRHGHARPEDVLVVGPLVEPYVMLPPSPEPAAVADWLIAHARTNEALPPTYGRSIRDVAPLAPRNVALNIIPPARPLAFDGETRATSASRDFLAPLWEGDRPVVPSTAAMWINYYMDQPGTVEVSLTYDTEVMPEPQKLMDAVAEVVAATAHEPDLGVEALRARLGA
ncbi:condensation domain-containing protein [Streptomyces sp. NPDC005485]|uniref:condensation domain-containing protein n=1 Tax=Streptomyces sp. NPDC005485 TaxID=3155591 RepID=UPI0033A959F3